MTNKDELLPCPFCGDSDELKIYDNGVNCNRCEIGGDLGHCVGEECRNLAIERWNTRTQQPIDVEKLKRNSCHYFRKTGQYCNDGCFVCEQDIGYNEAIDHLAASGYLRARLFTRVARGRWVGGGSYSV